MTTRIEWPSCFHNLDGVAGYGQTWNGTANLNAAGEMFAILVCFDGSEISEISASFIAGTAATSFDLEIQGVTGGDTISVTSFPDGTAIANGVADTLSNEGGDTEWLTWTFSGTKPAPVGYHWVVFIPSGGSFDIRFSYSTEYGGGSSTKASRIVNQSRLYDNTDWNNAFLLGSISMRVKKADDSYLDWVMFGHPPFAHGLETVNTRTANNNVCVGAKFTAPYGMSVSGLVVHLVTQTVFRNYEAVLIDSSDTELGRLTIGYYFTSAATRTNQYHFGSPITLTKDEVYRIYLVNPDNTIDSVAINTVTASQAIFNLTAADWQYTTATNPPSEGGAGGWTDTAGEVPLMYLLAEEDMATLTAGGGGGGGDEAPARISWS